MVKMKLTFSVIVKTNIKPIKILALYSFQLFRTVQFSDVQDLPSFCSAKSDRMESRSVEIVRLHYIITEIMRWKL
jgi:hypothetical protein